MKFHLKLTKYVTNYVDVISLIKDLSAKLAVRSTDLDIYDLANRI